jgi:hypothetical protein
MKNTGLQLIDNSDTGDVMDVKIVPVRDSSNKIVSGFVIGTTLEQNISLMLMLHQGELKFKPDLGVGIQDIVLSSDFLIYRHRIREHLRKDNLIVSQVDLFENKPFKIIADYGN